jgi:hypothetical protein
VRRHRLVLPRVSQIRQMETPRLSLAQLVQVL